MAMTPYGFVVIGVFLLIVGGAGFLAIKKTRIFMILVGVAAILAAFPLGFFLELDINGCCGAPSTGREGLGFMLGALVGVAGIVLLLLSRKLFRKKTPQK